MNKTKKLSIILSILVFSSIFLNINAQDLSNRIPDIPTNYEEEYSRGVCAGADNIVMAGCSVIAGQAVRGIPAMAFGASFDKIKGCVKQFEQRSGTSVKIDTNDTCNQYGLMNPKLDSSKFVFEKSNKPSNDYSVLGLAKSLHNLNQDIVQNSFDNSYFAFKAVENVPIARNAFAQTPGEPELQGLGGYFKTVTYNTWVVIRNVAYALIGLLSIVLGLTLMSSNSMFDNNAKWRLSLEQAIPRVVIAVILIQFSYVLGETLLFIANNSNFEPIFRYIFNVPVGGWTGVVVGLSALAPASLLGLVLALWSVTNPFGGVILIGMLAMGLWYTWRLIVLWWHNFNAVIAICLFTMASPLIIALSLLPGEAGALQTRRYFSTLVSLVSRTFLLQLISVGPTILLWTLYNYITTGGAGSGFLSFIAPATYLFPLIGGIIILGYADNAQNLSNQFAKSVTGADPIGGQQQGR